MTDHRLAQATLTFTLTLVAAFFTTACGDAGDRAANERGAAEPTEQVSEPTAQRAPARGSDDGSGLPDAVSVEEAVLPLRLNVYSRAGYWASDGTLMIDVLERDLVYATVMIMDAEGRPVRGLRPTVTPGRDSRFVPLPGDDVVSGDLGDYRFGMLGGTMGEERVEISVDDFGTSLILNVISDRASGYDWLAEIEGVIDWGLLLEADVAWGDEGISATFPEEVAARSGQTVKLVGFVMPLEATLEQQHFLLTSSPPGCFFHVPGGPAGAVEVFSSKPLSLGFDPVVFEGRFEALASNDAGVVYRLHDARILDPPRRSPAQ